MVINIETSSQEDKIKSKEKVLEVDEEKKVIKEGKNEIIICLNNKDISTKKRRRRRRKYCKERVDTEDKCFPFTTGKGMILCSKINDELTPQISSTNSCDSSQDTTPKSQQDSSPPNRNAGNKEESFKFKEKKNKGSNKGFYEEEKPNEDEVDEKIKSQQFEGFQVPSWSVRTEKVGQKLQKFFWLRSNAWPGLNIVSNETGDKMVSMYFGTGMKVEAPLPWPPAWKPKPKPLPPKEEEEKEEEEGSEEEVDGFD